MGLARAEHSVQAKSERCGEIRWAFQIWSEVKYNFGFPEKLVALHCDQMYLDWIPRVLSTQSTTDYYLWFCLAAPELCSAV